MIEDNNSVAVSGIAGVFQSQVLATETKLSDKMNHLGETIDRGSSAEPVDKWETYRGIFKIVAYVEFPKLKRNCFFKKKTIQNCKFFRICSTNTIKCLKREFKLLRNKWVTLLVQLQPRLQEVEREFVIATKKILISAGNWLPENQ